VTRAGYPAVVSTSEGSGDAEVPGVGENPGPASLSTPPPIGRRPRNGSGFSTCGVYPKCARQVARKAALRAAGQGHRIDRPCDQNPAPRRTASRRTAARHGRTKGRRPNLTPGGVCSRTKRWGSRRGLCQPSWSPSALACVAEELAAFSASRAAAIARRICSRVRP